MSVKLISITPEAEKIMGYCARVSNPDNQNNPEVYKLLAYCIKNLHWSIFEMAHLTVEIQTSRAISAQILRHRSFNFQEFSARYQQVNDYVTYQARRQDVKNRQNSIDDLPAGDKIWFEEAQQKVWLTAKNLYDRALERGIAKESCRFLLPMNSKTTIYMSGNIRSWITYIQVRTDPSTQLEHRELAEQVKSIFIDQLPQVSKALGWTV